MERGTASKKEFEKLLPALPGGKAAARVRAKSLEDFFASGGLPHPKKEGWRYADFTRLSKAHLAPAAAPAKPEKAGVSPYTGWPLAVLSGGAPELSGKLPKGARLEATRALLKKGGPEARALWLPAVAGNPFDQLNRSFAEDGFAFTLAKGQTLPGLELVIRSHGLKEQTRYLRNLIRLEEGAKATLAVRTQSLDQGGWLNLATKIRLGPGAELTLYGDFEASEEMLTSALMHATLAKGARLRYRLLAAGAPSLRHEIHLDLEGEGAEADLAGGLLAGAGENIDVLTRITHAVPNAASRQLFKGVASEKGRTAYQGRIVVEEGAQKTEARQTCNNLLLEAGGETNVKPELLIFADDVVCSHGATVGEIQEDALFYLMQRGIPEGEARRILVAAFLGDMLGEIEAEPVRAAFEDKVKRWMKRHEATGDGHE